MASENNRSRLTTIAASAAVGFTCGVLAAGAAALWRRQKGDGAESEYPIFGEFDASKLVRPNIARLVPYRCARDDYDTGILLDANENSYGPPMDGMDQFAPEINRWVAFGGAGGETVRSDSSSNHRSPTAT
jgi:hypothetical protein